MSGGTTVPAASETPRRERRRRIVLDAHPSARTVNRYGPYVYRQICLLRLQGHGIAEIARAIGCSTDIVSDLVGLWLAQVAALPDGSELQPLLRDPRRESGRRRRRSAPIIIPRRLVELAAMAAAA